MSDTVRKAITGRVTGPRPTGGQAWFMLAFSLPFLAIGTGIIIWGIRGAEPTGIATPKIVIPFGSLFAGAGLFLAFTAARGIARGARRKRLLGARPDEPWHADHPWDPQGARDNQPADIGKLLLFAIGWCGIVGVIQYIFLTKGLEGFGWVSLFPGLIFVVFDAIGVAIIVWLILKIVRYLRYGRAAVRFAQFPYFLGDRIELSVAVPASVGGDQQIDCTLRFIEEVLERDKSGESCTGMWQLYADRQTIKLERPFGRGEEFPLRFDLPAGDYGTQLARSEPRYWELQLTAERPDLNFEARFLLPIYARPSADASAGIPPARRA